MIVPELKWIFGWLICLVTKRHKPIPFVEGYSICGRCGQLGGIVKSGIVTAAETNELIREDLLR